MILWDVASGEVRDVLPPGLANDVSTVVFSDQGALGSAGSDNVTVRAPGTVDTNVVSPVPEGLYSAIAFSPDGDELASSGFARAGARTASVAVWNWAATPPVPVPLPTNSRPGWDGRFASLEYNPTGTVLAGAGAGGVQFWDVSRGAALGRLVGPSGASSGTFSPDGELFIVGYATGAVQAYPATVEGWQDTACSLVSRNLTSAEWTSVVGADVEYRKTCPQF
jgi:WD40 repeat protein